MVYWIGTARSVFTGEGLKWLNITGQFSDNMTVFPTTFSSCRFLSPVTLFALCISCRSSSVEPANSSPSRCRRSSTRDSTVANSFDAFSVNTNLKNLSWKKVNTRSEIQAEKTCQMPSPSAPLPPADPEVSLVSPENKRATTDTYGVRVTKSDEGNFSREKKARKVEKSQRAHLEVGAFLGQFVERFHESFSVGSWCREINPFLPRE